MTRLHVMTRERLADTETPVSAYLKLARGRSDSFLLESAETREITGRFSIVAFDPIFGMELERDRLVSWNGNGRSEQGTERFFHS